MLFKIKTVKHHLNNNKKPTKISILKKYIAFNSNISNKNMVCKNLKVDWKTVSNMM